MRRRRYGFCIPVQHEEGKTEFEPQDSPVVCFVSRPTEVSLEEKVGGGDPQAYGRSLIQSAASSYDLPPLSRVTLVKVEGPGTWKAFGWRPKQRLCVCPAHAKPPAQQ